MSSTEKILSNEKRLKLAFVIERPHLHRFYEEIVGNHWPATAVSYTKEFDTFMKLPSNVRNAIVRIVTFFSSSDGLVIENLVENFQKELEFIPEIKNFLIMQGAQELIHNQTYSLEIHSIIPDEAERRLILESSIRDDFISKIHDWAIGFMSRDRPLMERLLAFACFEGIIFSSAFAFIYWIKSVSKGDDMVALTTTNEYIARDECLHADFTLAVYKTLTDKNSPDKSFDEVSKERIQEIVSEAVNVAVDFSAHCMEGDFPGLSMKDMSDYIKHTANVLCDDNTGVGCGKIYNVKNPFSWMVSLNLRNKTNFFEHHATEYSRKRNTEIVWDNTEIF